MGTTQDRIDEIVARLGKSFESQTANDEFGLQRCARMMVLLDDLEDEIETIRGRGIADNIGTLRALLEMQTDKGKELLDLEKSLGITRADRKKDNANSVAEYTRGMLSAAKEFLDDYIKSLRCPKCKIELAQIYAIQDFTEYKLTVVCHQCNEKRSLSRAGASLFDQYEDGDWRKAYPAEIVLPVDEDAPLDLDEPAPDVVIGGDGDGSTE